ncbi:MAG: SpoIID/LytB domain-containing protein [Candidatus Magasanikbacteria bacterium]
MFKKTNLFLVVFFALCSLFIFNITKAQEILPVVSIRDEGLVAKYVSQSVNDPIKIEAGSTLNIDIKFKNVGTKIWDNSGKNFISAFTMEPRYRASSFVGSNWIDKTQTTKMSPAVVKVGETGTLSIQIKAPEKVGVYKEKFWLASQNYSWLKGGYFYFEFSVVSKTTVSSNNNAVPNNTVSNNTSSTNTNEISSYKAKKVMFNKKEVLANGGQAVKLILGLQNLGSVAWKKYTILANSPASVSSSNTSATFADNSWINNNTVLENNTTVEQWSTTRDEFNFVTPAKQGNYNLTLKLMADDKMIEDFELNIPVTVTADAPNYVSPQFDTDSSNIVVEESPRLAEEPKIRVGLWQNPEDQVIFKSNEDDFVVFAGSEEKGVLSQSNVAKMFYKEGVYYFSSADLNFESSEYLRLVPANNWHAVFDLTNFERKVTWKGPSNFNKYRGAMELRKVSSGSDVYVIEEVLMEDYVAGIAETSNAGPKEYIKALLTAARTYAYYIKEYTTKHDARNFDVVAHTGDQLYLGYASELLMPNVVSAQQETRGYMVTYNKDYIITPYYSTSDGRTRSWTEVWGGAHKPWLVSVPAIYDAKDKKAMAGHGVGMSARDAAYMADEAGTLWKDILKYYYTGVSIDLIYR